MNNIQDKFIASKQSRLLTLYYYNTLLTFFKARNEKNSLNRHFLLLFTKIYQNFVEFSTLLPKCDLSLSKKRFLSSPVNIIVKKSSR